jgi:RND family efflux transporter MFP subunit
MSLSPRAVICASILLAAGAAACRRGTPKATETEAPIPVIAEAVELGDIRGMVSATGMVAALPGADFAATPFETGRIVEISKQVGDHVKSGEVLVRFEFPALGAESAARAAAVKSADLLLQSAKLVQTRVHSLFDHGAASHKEVDDADQDVSNADAALTEARASQIATDALGQRTTIRAPFDGVVAERLHNPGDLVGAGTSDSILRVIDPRQVEIVATVAVADLTRFAVGASAHAVSEGKATPELLRVVSRPEPAPGATTVPVRLTFEQPTEMAAGTQVGIEIDAEQRSNVALVPATAVVRDAANHAAVFVAAGNQASRRPVVPGLVDTAHVEIRSGVRAGELVITQGQGDLRDGTAISVSPPDTPAPVK